jgi:phosphohistidine phosphatase
MSRTGDAAPQAPPRELLVLRHARSAWDTNAPSDFARPLTTRGRRDSPRVGAWLHARGLLPDLAFCSPAARAEETLTLAFDSMGLDPRSARFDDCLYEIELHELLAFIEEHAGDARRVLIVGHNPAFGELVRHLAATLEPHSGKFFPTAALARLRVPKWTPLTRGCADLLDLVRPRTLPR